MKIKTTLILSIASLTLLFAACGDSANTNTTAYVANKSNTATVVNSSTTANNTAAPSNTAASNSGATADNSRFKGEYMVGDVKCTVTADDQDLMHDVRCADNSKVQKYSRDDEPPKAIIVSENQKSRFVFDNAQNLSDGNFTDEAGKTVKVTRAK